MASGIGARLDHAPPTMPAHAWWFGEDQGRYVVTCAASSAAAVLEAAQEADLAARMVGTTGGDDLSIDGAESIAVSELRQVHERWLPDYMGATEIVA